MAIRENKFVVIGDYSPHYFDTLEEAENKADALVNREPWQEIDVAKIVQRRNSRIAVKVSHA